MSSRWPGGSFGLVLALQGSGSEGSRDNGAEEEEEDEVEEEEEKEAMAATGRLSFGAGVAALD